MSRFSNFIRNASDEEKTEVYDKVITRACARQEGNMTAFEEWWKEGGNGELREYAEYGWNAAMKEAARICREQIPPNADSDLNWRWSEACEYCAVEIEQSGG